MHGTDHKQFTFSKGIEQRGSEIQKTIRIIEMWNAWLPKNEVGAVEAMPGDSDLITITGLSSQIISWLHGTNPDTGRLGFVACSRNGTVSYAYYDGSTSVGNLLGSISGKDWLFAGIVRVGVPDADDPGNYKHNFMLFQGDNTSPSPRLGQKTEIGSTEIDDIGVPRPSTPADDIWIELDEVGSGTEVKSVVRYYISETEGGAESALSERIHRKGAIPYFLRLSDAAVQFDDATYRPNAYASSFAVSFMIRKDEIPNAAEFVIGARGGLGGPGLGGWSCHVAATTGTIHFEIDDGVTEWSVNTSDDVCDGLWHRVVCAYDHTGNTMKIWRDDEIQNTTSSVTPVDAGTSNGYSMTLGKDQAAANALEADITDLRFFDGLIADGNLEDDMHRQISDLTATPAWDDLASYWKFENDLVDTQALKDGTISGSGYEWLENNEYGEAQIDCGEGDNVLLDFDATRFHGNTYNIYRSLADGVVAYKVGQLTPKTGAHVFTDNTPDEDVGNVSYLHGDQPPEQARPAIAFANRVFVAVKNRVYWTDIASTESYWNDNIQGNWVDVYPEDGDEITALAADRDGILVFKTDHIYKIYGRNPVDFQARPIAPTSTMPIALGAANLNCVCEVPQGVAFFWNKKVFIYSSEASITRVSRPIEDELEAEFGPTSYAWYGASVGYDAERDYIWVSLPDSSTGPSKSYLFDLGRGEWVGMRSRGYRGMQTIRSIEAWWTSVFNESIFAGVTDTTGGYNVIKKIVDPTQTDFADGGGYTSHVTLSPFWGKERAARKRFMYLDVTFVPTSTPGEFDVTYWVDGKEASADSVTIDMQGTDSRKTVRVGVREFGTELSVKIGNTPATDGIFKILAVSYGYQEHESIQ